MVFRSISVHDIKNTMFNVISSTCEHKHKGFSDKLQLSTICSLWRNKVLFFENFCPSETVHRKEWAPASTPVHNCCGVNNIMLSLELSLCWHTAVTWFLCVRHCTIVYCRSFIPKVDLVPLERMPCIEKKLDGTIVNDLSPCSGFSRMYICMCDFYGYQLIEEIIWDLDTIYLSQDSRTLYLRDFDHLSLRYYCSAAADILCLLCRLLCVHFHAVCFC